MADATQYDIFISYAHEDVEFVEVLDAGLESQGVTTWRDRRRLQPTDLWKTKIREALLRSRCMVLILSQASINSSAVQEEYDIVTSANQDRPMSEQILVLPVRYETYTETVWRPELQRQWIDISEVKTTRMKVATALNEITFYRQYSDLSELTMMELYNRAQRK
ncbi:MAG TPA: toll/interleukin-1 receptor domain-containing protein [Ktedonobacterales bacterium]|nr:toll/interleukin-1 receptor domain-containing protein [Ktedonobacterales bacterium]